MRAKAGRLEGMAIEEIEYVVAHHDDSFMTVSTTSCGSQVFSHPIDMSPADDSYGPENGRDGERGSGRMGRLIGDVGSWLRRRPPVARLASPGQKPD